MKIVHINSLYPPNIVGGAEQGLQVISDALSKLGHEVHVITLKGPQVDEVSNQPQSSVTVHNVTLANIYWPFNGAEKKRLAAARAIWHGIDTWNEAMVRKVEAIVRKISPDVVVTHNLQGFSTAIMPAIKRLDIPLVHVIHDCSLLCVQTSLYRNGRACGLCEKRCAPCRMLTLPRIRHAECADAVVGVSQSVLNLHRKHGLFTDTPQTVIFNALKPSIPIQEAPPARNADDVFTFGFLGRIERSKGIETLLRATQALELQGQEFRLLIAGNAEPGYLDFLQQTLPVKSVEYVGYVDAAAFLRQLDTLVFPSEWMEALGNGVFEAFSQGVPVIGSNVGGIPESVDHGTTGLVFDAGDTLQLSNLMMDLASRPHAAQAMGRAGLRKSHEYLSANRANEYSRYLESVVRDIAVKAAA